MGRTRAGVLAATDVLLAMKAASNIVADRDERIVGWIRVANPGACDLCSAADGTVYDAADDMGIHPGCGCTLDPSLSGDGTAEDPAHVTTHDHGELGPVIYETGDHFART
jgi:hypothetical protein